MCLLIPAPAGSVHSHWTKESGKGKPGSIGGSGTSSTLGKHQCIWGWRLLASTPPQGGPGRLARAAPVDASLDDSFLSSPRPSLRTTVCSPDYQLQPATLKILCCEDFLRFRFKSLCALPSVQEARW